MVRMALTEQLDQRELMEQLGCKDLKEYREQTEQMVLTEQSDLRDQ